VALTGTAVALPSTDTVFSDDIVNGEVKTNDISDTNGVRSADVRDDDLSGGGLAAIDLARNSVGGPEIAANAVSGSEIAAAGVGKPEIGPDAVGSSEIATDGVGSAEIGPNAVGSSEIATDTVGKAEIVTDGVGANELDEVHEHESEEQIVEDGTAHDGAYGIGSVVVSCLFDSEDLLSVSIDWTDTNDHSERMLADVVIERSGTDSAVVQGAFDGGGGASNPAAFKAIATCLQS
jgi:hypothetical protein